jgi:hypothetical protein
MPPIPMAFPDAFVKIHQTSSITLYSAPVNGGIRQRSTFAWGDFFLRSGFYSRLVGIRAFQRAPALWMQPIAVFVRIELEGDHYPR